MIHAVGSCGVAHVRCDAGDEGSGGGCGWRWGRTLYSKRVKKYKNAAVPSEFPPAAHAALGCSVGMRRRIRDDDDDHDDDDDDDDLE